MDDFYISTKVIAPDFLLSESMIQDVRLTTIEEISKNLRFHNVLLL